MTDTAAPSQPWIAYVPVPLFATVMGLSGLGLAWRMAAAALGWPGWPGETLLAAAAACFVLLACTYVAKAARFGAAVAAEFQHPVVVNFFPAISIGLMLLAAGVLPYQPAAANGIWLAGAALQLLLAVIIMARWIARNFEIHHASPAWFIPVVGNIVAPITGVRLGYVEPSWFFFAIGLTFWLVLFPIVVNRIVFHDQLPAQFVPTLFILMAPPAVGFLAYIELNGGQLDALARVLLFGAVFIALLLVALMRLFLAVPFAISWWAYTFPSAAVALALLRYLQSVGGTVPRLLAIVALLVATAIVGVVTVRTLAALLGRRLFVPQA